MASARLGGPQNSPVAAQAAPHQYPAQPGPVRGLAVLVALGLGIFFLANRVETGADEMVTKLAAFDIGVARSTLGNRVAFAETMATGHGVSEAEPSSAAAHEIAALAREIWDRTAGS